MPPFRLILQSDENHYPGALESLVQQIPQTSHLGILVTEPKRSAKELGHYLEKVEQWAASILHHYTFVIDRADLALSFGLFGVFLSSNSIPCHKLHPLLRQNLSIGVMGHSKGDFLKAQQSGANFGIFEGSFEDFEKRCSPIPFPIFAKGDIGVEQVEAYVRSGVYGIVLQSEIWESTFPHQTLEQYQYHLLRSQLFKS